MCSRGSIHFSKQDRRSCAPRQPQSNAASARLELFDIDLNVGQYQDHDAGAAERMIESVTLRFGSDFPGDISTNMSAFTEIQSDSSFG